MNLLETLRSAFAAATPEGGDPSAFSAAVRPSTDPKFGDYQANGCMALAKALKANPRELAAQVAERVDLSPLADRPEVAGPGFLNVRLRDDWLAEAVRGLLDDENLGLEPPPDDQSLKVVIDYSSPNVAKPMHVGHIRSTVIGESLARLFEALGHDVVRDNHLGDWGSQFGMILWGWKNERNEAAYNENPVGELARLYRSVASQIKTADDLEEQYAKVFALEKQGKQSDAEALFNNLYDGTGLSLQDVHAVVERGRRIETEARAETAKLHANDGENRALWGQFMPHCLAALGQIYDRLDVSFDVQLGESFYDDMLAGVVKSLQDKGLAVESEGALVVFSEGHKAPFIVRKRDGAYNYATTDLATIQYRVETWHPDLILYVVDTRQSDHFKALFDVARRWGFDEPRYEHVAFGTILGPDRRPYRTRSGDTVGLESLLDEAVAKALQVVQENSPDLDAEEQASVAEIVGLGAIKYADLSQNRLSDYIFDYEKMMARKATRRRTCSTPMPGFGRSFSREALTLRCEGQEAADSPDSAGRTGPGPGDSQTSGNPATGGLGTEAEHPHGLPVFPGQRLQHILRGLPGAEGGVGRTPRQPAGSVRPDGPHAQAGFGPAGDRRGGADVREIAGCTERLRNRLRCVRVSELLIWTRFPFAVWRPIPAAALDTRGL